MTQQPDHSQPLLPPDFPIPDPDETDITTTVPKSNSSPPSTTSSIQSTSNRDGIPTKLHLTSNHGSISDLSQHNDASLESDNQQELELPKKKSINMELKQLQGTKKIPKQRKF